MNIAVTTTGAVTDTMATDDQQQEPFAVVVTKLTTGARILFSRYPTRNAAQAVVDALRAHQLAADVVRADGLPARPGASISGPARDRRARHV